MTDASHRLKALLVCKRAELSLRQSSRPQEAFLGQRPELLNYDITTERLVEEIELLDALTPLIASEAGRVQEAIQAALSALSAVEWTYSASGWSPVCYWCRGYQRHPAMDQDYSGTAGHTADCPRQVALEKLTAALHSSDSTEAMIEQGAAAHPMQPVYKDKHGVVRFKPNAIVNFVLDWCAGQNRVVGCQLLHTPHDKAPDVNTLAQMDFSQEDWTQLAQLLGYSVSGFGELSYVSDDDYSLAECRAKKLEPTS